MEVEKDPLHPSLHLVVPNPSRGTAPLGPLLRVASAYGATSVVFIGYPEYNSRGSHGSDAHLHRTAFPTWESNNVVDFLRREGEEIHIVGVVGARYDRGEGCDGSVPIHERPFGAPSSTTVFVVDRPSILSGVGISADLLAHCDALVHVPVRPIRGTDVGENCGLIDVPSCLAIILHHHAAWAGRPERGLNPGVPAKFQVDAVGDRPMSGVCRGKQGQGGSSSHGMGAGRGQDKSDDESVFLEEASANMFGGSDY